MGGMNVLKWEFMKRMLWLVNLLLKFLIKICLLMILLEVLVFLFPVFHIINQENLFLILQVVNLKQITEQLKCIFILLMLVLKEVIHNKVATLNKVDTHNKEDILNKVVILHKEVILNKAVILHKVDTHNKEDIQMIQIDN